MSEHFVSEHFAAQGEDCDCFSFLKLVLRSKS